MHYVHKIISSLVNYDIPKKFVPNCGMWVDSSTFQHIYYVQRNNVTRYNVDRSHRLEVKNMGTPNLGRFSDPSILILASLAGGAKHGYAIMEDIETFAGMRPGPGTLYGAIARLEEYGLIEPLPSEERRRPYRLTATGITFLREQLSSLETFAAMGLRRLASI